jgi:ligand-binding sensor domain-containing protein/two-component sensor histidine kinase
MGVGDSRGKRITGRIMAGASGAAFRMVCLCVVHPSAARVVCLIAILLLVLAASIRAEHLPIKTYTIADGLAHDLINRIRRDSHGYLWFCTREGLSRFDGYTFTNYAKGQGLPGRDVNDLLETRDGVYWVATDVGVYRFNPTGSAAQSNSRMKVEKSQSRRPAESSTEPMFVAYYQSGEPKPYYANVLLEDHAGLIWCGTNFGVYQLTRAGDQRSFRFVDMGMPTMKPEEPAVQTLVEDHHGALWVGTMASGLYRYLSDGHTERYTTRQGLLTNDIRALLEDREGHLWVGTRGNLSLLVSNPMPNQLIVARALAKKDGLVANEVRSLFQSADGRLWVGMYGGLSSFVPAHDGSALQISSVTTRNGLTGPAVWAIAEDREGNLWLASYGALKMVREGFTTYREDDGLATINISSIFANQKGEMCTVSSGIKKIINQFDGKKFTAAMPNLPKQIKYTGWGWNQITFQDHTGEWWVTTGQGLVRFPKVNRIEQLAHTPPKAVYHALAEIPVDEVFRLYEDARGDIWISAGLANTGHWIIRWERATDTFHTYTEADGLPLDDDNFLPLTTAFREDRAGNLWVGFSANGLARLRNGRFTVFTTNDGLPAGWIKDLYLDHAGRLWIASSREGLSRIDDPATEHPRFINYRTDNGLASDSAWCITEDEWHRIYVGTSRGVDRIDPETGHIRHYTQADGLAQNEVQVAFRDAHGSLWFGTDQGLSRFYPQPDESSGSLPVFISGLRVNGLARPLSELGEVTVSKFVLGPYENQMQVDFGGLDFGTGKELRYQYKLEGADRDWSYPTDVRTVNYASLPSGHYRFLVRAVTADGILSPVPATITFSILSPIWQRWWFLTLVALTIGLATYGLYRYRLARLIELERVRTRIATDLHDDIGSNLSVVAGLSEVLRLRMGTVDETIDGQLSVIAKVSQRSVDAMSDIVWAVNPKKDHLRDLVQRMRRFASDAFSARNIQLVFEAPEADQNIRLGAETRRQVFLIFKESVNNAARHSGCAQAKVSLTVTNGTLAFNVSDDGKGFDGDAIEAGEGLLSMRQRAKKIGSELIITSSAGTGTTVQLRAPLVEKLL